MPSTMTAGSPRSWARPSASRISPVPTPMRWRSGRTDIGVRLRILGRDPPSTPTQLSITWAITPEGSSATNASSGMNCSDARMRSTNVATSSGWSTNAARTTSAITGWSPSRSGRMTTPSATGGDGSCEDVRVVEGQFVPSGFVVPLALATEQFRLEPLGPQHNDSDYEAWSSSVEHVPMTPGWETSSWPDDRSRADNLRDLQRHADDFENRRGFTYTVLEPATGDVIGCVYIYPDKSEQHDARVLSWVTVTRAEL